MLLQTIWADAGEADLIAADLAAGVLLDMGEQLVRQLDRLRVEHRAAALTDDVRVWDGVAVVALQPVHHADRIDHALGLEGREIAIDRAQAEIRDIAVLFKEEFLQNRTAVNGKRETRA